MAESNDELPPDPHRLIQGLVRSGLRLPSFPSANNFLYDCRRKSIGPDPERLVRVLLPWSRSYPV